MKDDLPSPKYSNKKGVKQFARDFGKKNGSELGSKCFKRRAAVSQHQLRKGLQEDLSRYRRERILEAEEDQN